MPLNAIAAIFLRASLVLVLLIFGGVKFFAIEAQTVAPLIAAHPLLFWLGPLFGQGGAARILGVTEIAAGIMLTAGFVSPGAGLAGGVAAMTIFFTTITLMLFMPSVLVFETSAGGFPAIGTLGGFIFKDIVLFAAAFSCFAESMMESQSDVILLRNYR